MQVCYIPVELLLGKEAKPVVEESDEEEEEEMVKPEKVQTILVLSTTKTVQKHVTRRHLC